VRSRMMAGIRGKNTKPELLVRSTLHRRGFRFRLHDKKLPGRPDLVLPKWNAVIFINGCFWHGHDCYLFKEPKTRPRFWREKIDKNRQRDRQAHIRLLDAGWRVMLIWECALKGRSAMPADRLVTYVERWLTSGMQALEIAGRE
jgi:DNA mismatch endonuclease (patch repair protein)